MRTRVPDPNALGALTSQTHLNTATQRFLDRYHVVESRAVSSSLKFGLIARGEADIYPRTGPTSEWDTAAGHAVLAAAGGTVTTLDGQPLLYGKPGFLNPGFRGLGAHADSACAEDGVDGAARMCTANANPRAAAIWPHFRNTLREFFKHKRQFAAFERFAVAERTTNQPGSIHARTTHRDLAGERPACLSAHGPVDGVRAGPAATALRRPLPAAQ